ncbi:hypothetical protein MS3_00008644 [Schistosoma haematobium]|uniref:Neuronal membrane glycoprotein M6-b n=1 Tax=Schistosoma haematobium TaxID=6185 RepID=A0A922LW93_SCHHA|nr:hypothetical protein MS3_00008644 [Schistosoma haematobium]KAH9594823.1 hypothetical protein MS3_00008644 [Schistosoma haematobium]CAH8452451.1 unnamed protein product [Schistosoma haematobium]
MSEYYEGDNSCVRCLRSSPIASLVGFIIVLLGGGAFGGAIIFARRYLITLLNAPNLFPYLDYAIYGLVGAIGLFSLLAYLLCALSSGWNAKHYFESSRKACCGRCCNMTLIILLVTAVILWSAIACLVSYPVVSIALLLYRNEGPSRLRLASVGQMTSAYHDGQVNFLSPSSSYTREMFNTNGKIIKRRDTEEWFPNHPSDFDTDESTIAIPDDIQDNLQTDPSTLSRDLTATVTSPKMVDQPPPVISSFVDDNLPSSSSSSVPSKSSLKPLSKKIIKQVMNDALSIPESIKLFHQCSQETFDLSYYGLYDTNGLPIHIARANFSERIYDILVCVILAIAGIFLLLFGYIQIIICTAMNYARMQEARYYETSDVGEEGVALQQ